MVKFRYNAIRTLEIQIKNGYLKTIPEEYEFLKRYPPLSRDGAARLKNINVDTIPYVKYYNQALERNPALVGEHVYPAYWRQQPLALILAKKQYEFIQQGIDEDEAYHKAVAYVDIEESKSYENMKQTLDTIDLSKETRKSFISDPKIAQVIQAWRLKLQTVPYEDLDLAEQGE